MKPNIKVTGSTVISTELIQQIASDPRYSYDMPFFEFTKLLKYYNGMSNSVDMDNMDENTIVPTKSNKAEILDQREIDDLIKSMGL